MPSLIEIHKASKIYTSEGLPVSALDEVDLQIESGDFVTLAGPSGSGKSTLLHLLGALDRPTSGAVYVAGLDLSQMSPQEAALFRLQKIGFVFQAYNLIPVLTAFENVEYPLLLQKIPIDERRRRSDELLDRVGLSEHKNKKPGEMSGGQQQRVAVARALATRPSVVLADEPTANLDSKTGTNLIDLFRELNKQYQTTFVFASHDPIVIERANRVVRLKDGRVLV